MRGAAGMLAGWGAPVCRTPGSGQRGPAVCWWVTRRGRLAA